MTNSRNQDREGKTPTGEPTEPVSPKRRRLIKGFAAAAPGIFTLYSGNAQAMLSNNQCIAQSGDAFTGELEFAGEDHLVDGFVRLAEGPGIHVVRTAPGNSGNAPGNSGNAPGNAGVTGGNAGVALSNVPGAAPDKPGVALSNVGRAPSNFVRQDKWLIMVTDNAGVAHYIEAGDLAGNIGNATSGTSWNDSLAGVEWLPADDSGTGDFSIPLKLIDPTSDPSDPDIYIQDFKETKTIQVLACIDDSGNVVSAFPQDCEALGLTPPAGSCWASVGTASMGTWWG